MLSVGKLEELFSAKVGAHIQ